MWDSGTPVGQQRTPVLTGFEGFLRGVLRHPPMWSFGHLVKTPSIPVISRVNFDHKNLLNLVSGQKNTQNRLFCVAVCSDLC